MVDPLTSLNKIVYNIGMTTKEKPIVKKGKLKNPTTFTYTAKDGVLYSLNRREKAFCDSYLKFGAKGVDAVYEAGYNPKNVRVAYAIASENLSKPKMFNYINSKYEEYGFNDDDVLKEHLFLIKQDGDLASKAKGVDMYYKKKGIYAPEKHEHTVTAVRVVNYRELEDGDNSTT